MSNVEKNGQRVHRRSSNSSDECSSKRRKSVSSDIVIQPTDVIVKIEPMEEPYTPNLHVNMSNVEEGNCEENQQIVCRRSSYSSDPQIRNSVSTDIPVQPPDVIDQIEPMEQPSVSQKSTLSSVDTTRIASFKVLVEANEPTPVQKEILKKLEQIQDTLKEHSKLLERLLKVERTYETPLSIPNIPVDSFSEMQEWENYLKNADNFSNCIQYFLHLTGHDASSSVRQILTKIITNGFAQEYNWNGRPPKIAFKSLKTVALILSTVKANPLTKDISKFSIENVIKDWLKHASFRENYKKKTDEM